MSPGSLPITQICRLWRTVTHAYPPSVPESRQASTCSKLTSCSGAPSLSKSLLLYAHFRVGRRDIDDRQATIMTCATITILKESSHRPTRTHHLNPFPSTSRFWTSGAFNIPENLFPLEARIRSLQFSADRTLHAPDSPPCRLTSIQTSGKAPLLGLLDAELPTVPISMNRLKVFLVRTDSPRHFLMLVVHLAMSDTARMRPTVRTLAAPGCRGWTTWLDALPPFYTVLIQGRWAAAHPYLGRTNM